MVKVLPLFWYLQMAKPSYIKPGGPVYHSVFHGSHTLVGRNRNHWRQNKSLATTLNNLAIV